MSEPQISPALLAVVRGAAARLPEGWGIEIVDGDWPALELRLTNPRGFRLAGHTDEQRGPVWQRYRSFADLVFEAQQRLYPERLDQLAWGGNFTNALYQYRVGYFDLCGYRGHGRYQRPQERERAPLGTRGEGKRAFALPQ